MIDEVVSFENLGANNFSHLMSGLSNLLKSYKLLEDETFFLSDESSFSLQNKDTCSVTRINTVDLAKSSADNLCIIIPDEMSFNDINEIILSAYLKINKKTGVVNFISKTERYKSFMSHLKCILNNDAFYLTSEELTLLKKFNDTHKNYPEPHTIDQLFDQVCQVYPDHIAVADSQNQISYKNLNDLSHSISSFLVNSLGNVKGKRIALGISKSINLIASLFGVLRVGSTYVPLSSTYPSDRINIILEEAQPYVILCDKAFYEQNKEALNDKKILMIEDIPLASFPEKISSSTRSDDLAYIIFTSGTTNRPKGVMINHKGIVNLAHTAAELCSIKPESRILCFAHMGFDASAWDIYCALLNGATLYLPKDGIHTKAGELASYLLEHKINMATLTPGILSQLPDGNLFQNLKTLVVIGERCQKKTMNEWAMNRILMNGYGPTEATIATSLAIYDRTKSEICIGKPFYNYQVHILDDQKRPVGIGFVGEMWISGVGVARGYLNNEELAESNFSKLQLPYMDGFFKAFRTGDMARWTQDGEIEFLGRDDDQIKIKGVTVNPNEIENLINEYPNIKRSLVTLTEEENEKLIAYVTIENMLNSDEFLQFTHLLKEFLKKLVHPLMVPEEIIKVESFPLTYNGKINKNILPKPS